jgi:hypothetical protein
MSETHPLIAGSPEMARAIKRYITRCMLLMERAYQEKFDNAQAFREWAEERFQTSEDPALLCTMTLYTLSQGTWASLH